MLRNGAVLQAVKMLIGIQPIVPLSLPPSKPLYSRFNPLQPTLTATATIITTAITTITAATTTTTTTTTTTLIAVYLRYRPTRLSLA